MVTLHFIALFPLLYGAQGCLQDWNNMCYTNADCCSQLCKRENADWVTGVCQPGVSGGSPCLEDYNNQCTANSNCCSGICERGDASWATGVCKPSGGSSGGGTDPGSGSPGGETDPGTGNPGNGGDGGDPTSVSQAEFIAAVTSNGYPTPSSAQYNGFINGIPKGGIETKREAAMALAQFLHESAGLTAKEEWACQVTKCPYDYTNAGCEAPGQYYFGRGYIQLSWCYNYRDASRGLGLGDLLLNQPDLVATNEQYAWDTSFWFWKDRVRGGQYGQQVRNGYFGASTNAINGGLECRGYNLDKAQKRFQYYSNIYRAFGIAGTPNEKGCYN